MQNVHGPNCLGNNWDMHICAFQGGAGRGHFIHKYKGRSWETQTDTGYSRHCALLTEKRLENVGKFLGMFSKCSRNVCVKHSLIIMKKSSLTN